jgi:transcriptional regulator of acetoin/glycerol metabolism
MRLAVVDDKPIYYNIGQTAQILSLPRTTLWRKMKKYGLANSFDEG